MLPQAGVVNGTTSGCTCTATHTGYASTMPNAITSTYSCCSGHCPAHTVHAPNYSIALAPRVPQTRPVCLFSSLQSFLRYEILRRVKPERWSPYNCNSNYLMQITGESVAVRYLTFCYIRHCFCPPLQANTRDQRGTGSPF